MKRFLTQLIIIIIIATGVVAPLHKAYAKQVWDPVLQAWLEVPDNDTTIEDEAKAYSESSSTSGSACGALAVICIKDWIAWGAYYILTFTSWLAGMSGMLLDEAIQASVKTMSSSVNTGDFGYYINYGWTLVRDLGNFIFIFALLYVAITTILGLANSSTKRLIINIIIVGLLVNFSLYFTKALIDVSNVISLAFYNQFSEGGNSVAISNRLASFIDLQKIYDPATAGKVLAGQQSDTSMGLAIMGIGGSIFFLFTALTFLYAAFLFILRFLILVLLMVLSPIGYLGFMLPQTAGLAKKWWNLLIAQLAFAPIYMIMLSLVFMLAAGMKGSDLFKVGSAGLAGALTTTGNAIVGVSTGASTAETAGKTKTVLGPIINFILLIGFINAAAIISTAVATNTSGFIGGMTSRAGSFLRGSGRWAGRQTGRAAGAATFGAAGATGRYTAGWAASRMREGRTGAFLGRLASTEGTGILGVKTLARAAGRAGLSLTDKAAKANYDARNIKAIGALGLGQAEKRGYDEILEDKSKKAETRIKAAGGASSATMKVIREHRSALNTARQQYARAKTDAERITARNAIRKAKNDLSEANKKKDKEIKDQRTEYAYWLQSARVGNLWGLKGKKYKKAAEKFEASSKDADEKKAKADEKAQQVRDMLDATYITPADKVTAVTKAINDLTTDEIKELPSKILKEKEVVDNLDIAALEALQKSNKLSRADRLDIGTHLTTRMGTSGALFDYLNNRGKGYWS